LYAIKNIFAEKMAKKLTFLAQSSARELLLKRHHSIVFKEKIATFAEKLVKIAKNGDP
jgi:hypothetical protein